MSGNKLQSAFEAFDRLIKELKSMEHKSKMIKERFVPVEVPINNTYNHKYHKTTIRNQLPQRIRINEKSEL